MNILLLFVSLQMWIVYKKVKGIVKVLRMEIQGRCGIWYQGLHFKRNFYNFFFPDTIGPKEVGLKDESLEDERGHGLFGLSVFNRVDRWAQPITYVDIHEDQNFTVRYCAYLASCMCICQMHLCGLSLDCC